MHVIKVKLNGNDITIFGVEDDNSPPKLEIEIDDKKKINLDYKTIEKLLTIDN